MLGFASSSRLRKMSLDGGYEQVPCAVSFVSVSWEDI